MCIAAHHVTSVRAHILFGMSAQTTVNIAIFCADQIPTKQLGYQYQHKYDQ